MKQFLLHKWDYLKKIKSDLLQKKFDALMKLQAIKTKILFMKMIPMIKRISEIYNKKKKDIWYQERSLYVSFLTHRLMKKVLRKRGPSFEVRQNQIIKQ